MNRKIRFLFLIFFILTHFSCKPEPLSSLSIDDYQIKIHYADNKSETGFSLFSDDKKILSSSSLFFQTAFDEPDVKMQMGQHDFGDDRLAWQSFSYFKISKNEKDNTALLKVFDNKEHHIGTISILSKKKNQIQIKFSPQSKNFNRIKLSFECQENENYLGFGEQTDDVIHRGHTIPIWVSEGGIGKVKSKEDPNYFYPITGLLHDTYYPLPFFLSTKGYGLLLNTTYRSVFDMCDTQKDNYSIEIWENSFDITLYIHDDPKKIIRMFSDDNGKPKLPPPWAFFPWNDAIYGQSNVLRVAQKIRDNHIPSSVIWTEDWIGGSTITSGIYNLHYDYDIDDTLYPDFKSMVSNLHENKFKFLTYYNTFITQDTKQWDEAKEKDFLIKDTDNKIYTFSGPMLEKVSLLDLTNDKAIDWLQNYFKKTEELGVDGWMADFGEWLPFDSNLHSGDTGEKIHNTYPTQWHKANLDFWKKTRPNGDFLYFTRSGYLGDTALSPVTWSGDQNTDWSHGDGLYTVITSGINLGLCGVPYYGHDIGGYVYMKQEDMKQLFLRWIAIGAFSPIMKTHHGTKPKEMWSFEKDEETLQIYKKFAAIHAQLFPYLYSLAVQSETSGLPIMIHTYLEHPDDTDTASINDQYYLGKNLYVAPVIEPDTKSRKVILPTLSDTQLWYSYFDPTTQFTKKNITIKSSYDEIPVFVPAGAIIPEFSSPVETLFDSANTNDIIQAKEMKTLNLKIFLGRSGSFILFDDTTFELTSQNNTDNTLTNGFYLDDKKILSCADIQENCVSSDNVLHIFLKRGSHSISSSSQNITLLIDEKQPSRKYQIFFFNRSR